MSANERILAAEPGLLSAAWSRTRIGTFLSQPISWVFLLVGGIIGFLSLYPTFFLFYGSVMDAPLGVPGHFTLQNYVQAFGDPEAYPLLLNSFIFGLGAAGLSVIFALALAWITIRTNAPFRRLFELTAIIPNILPPILVSISWVMLLNPSNGLINGLFVKILGLEKGPFNIYSMAGLIFVEALILTPLAFLIIAAALKSMDPSLEESAKTLGSGELGVMSRITFPLMRPAILAAATLNFVRAVESFDTPAIIALPARIEVFTTKIWREALGSFPTNHNLAATYGVGYLDDRSALRLSLPPLYVTGGEFLHGHGQGLSSPSNRPRQVEVPGLRGGVSIARVIGCAAYLGSSVGRNSPLLSRADLADLEQFDPRSLSLYLGHPKGSPSIRK